MLNALITDLKEQLPEIFEQFTEEQVTNSLEATIKEYLEKRDLPKVLAKDNAILCRVHKLIRKHIKLPPKSRPKRDRLAYVAPEEKKCTKCSEIKPIEQFSFIQGRHCAHCKKCGYELYQRPAILRRLARKGKKPRHLMTLKCPEQKKLEARKRASKWAKANRERINANKKAQRALKNPPKPKIEKPVKVPKPKLTPEQIKANRREQKRLYRLNNPEKVAAERARYAQKAKACPHSKVAKNLRKRLKKFLETGTGIGSFSSMVGCTKQELMEHLASKFQDGMSWDNYGEWHIDHIKPLAAFDLSDATSRKEANHYSNLQPMWKLENEGKSSFWNGVRYSKGKPVE